MLSKESRAAASPLSLLDPAGLQSGWPHLHVRKVTSQEFWCHTLTSPPLSPFNSPPLIQLRISVKRLLTTAQFVRGRLAFLSGNQPVHLIKHSVSLWQDQQLEQEIKVMMKTVSILRKQILRWLCRCKSEDSSFKNQNSLLRLLQSSCWQWWSETVFPPPHPEHRKGKIKSGLFWLNC